MLRADARMKTRRRKVRQGTAIRRAKPRHLEAREQEKVVAWARLQLRAWGFPPKALFAIPNGAHLAGDAKQRALQMALLKKAGLEEGVSDLFLAIPRGALHGLWIEMKRCAHQYRTPTEAKAAWREDQQQFAAMVEGQGYRYELAYGFEHARLVIIQYLWEGRGAPSRID